MKKWSIVLLTVLLLSGCAQREVFEQVEDVYQVIAPQPGILLVEIPEDASVSAMGAGQENSIYFCDGYTLTVQTMAAGDLNRTMEDLTGFSTDGFALFQTRDGDVKQYEGTWTCAGEGGDQVGRLVLLDDGDYHYAVTVMASAEDAGDLRLAWDTVLGSVALNDTGT